MKRNISATTIFTPNFRDHAIVALLMGGWLYLFLAIIGPFDAADLTFRVRVQLMVGYGLIFMLVYLSCIPAQNWIYQHWNTWSVHSLLSGRCSIEEKAPPCLSEECP